VKLMNRATADNQSAQAEEEGLEPTKEWVKELIDEIIAEEFSSPDLELHWLDEDADPRATEAALEGRVKLGALTLNEMRGALGLDPFDNAAADRPMVLTPTGYVPIEAGTSSPASPLSSPAGLTRGSMQLRRSTERCVELGCDVLLDKYSPDEPRVPAGNPDGGQWTGENGSQSEQATPSDSRVVSDATPENNWIPGAQYADGIEEGEGENRIGGESAEGTPGQQARLAIAEAQWEEVRNQMRSIDPYWKPPAGAYETIEGGIADLAAKTQAGEAHIAELASKGIGPGPFACEYIDAQGPGRLNTEGRDDNNENGDEYGCHTCGTLEAGTPSGNWVGDHQPVSALNIFGISQRIYPQCLACSQRQGGAVMSILGKLK
jgi:hypothetical protein